MNETAKGLEEFFRGFVPLYTTKLNTILKSNISEEIVWAYLNKFMKDYALSVELKPVETEMDAALFIDKFLPAFGASFGLDLAKAITVN